MTPDSGIPMPPHGGHVCKYPWRTMEVGESFLFDGMPSQPFNTAFKAGRKYGRKFSCRKTREGIRVWRTA